MRTQADIKVELKQARSVRDNFSKAVTNYEERIAKLEAELERVAKLEAELEALTPPDVLKLTNVGGHQQLTIRFPLPLARRLNHHGPVLQLRGDEHEGVIQFTVKREDVPALRAWLNHYFPADKPEGE